jgi:mono/diheme cytochrome c family protein
MVLAAAALIGSITLQAQRPDWVIPPDADQLTSPLGADAAARGRKIFTSRCTKCHGPQGRGNGRESDKKHPAADLTRDEMATMSDGELFYKISNGRKPMPSFKTELDSNDIWAAVAYVRTLGPPRQ